MSGTVCSYAVKISFGRTRVHKYCIITEHGRVFLEPFLPSCQPYQPTASPADAGMLIFSVDDIPMCHLDITIPPSSIKYVKAAQKYKKNRKHEKTHNSILPDRITVVGYLKVKNLNYYRQNLEVRRVRVRLLVRYAVG